jgi:hypothetical protein
MTPREQLLGQVRPLSFALAYRIAAARAFVATVTARLSIDALRPACAGLRFGRAAAAR